MRVRGRYYICIYVTVCACQTTKTTKRKARECVSGLNCSVRREHRRERAASYLLVDEHVYVCIRDGRRRIDGGGPRDKKKEQQPRRIAIAIYQIWKIAIRRTSIPPVN